VLAHGKAVRGKGVLDADDVQVTLRETLTGKRKPSSTHFGSDSTDPAAGEKDPAAKPDAPADGDNPPNGRNAN
jgi:hypothetical protein